MLKRLLRRLIGLFKPNPPIMANTPRKNFSFTLRVDSPSPEKIKFTLNLNPDSEIFDSLDGSKVGQTGVILDQDRLYKSLNQVKDVVNRLIGLSKNHELDPERIDKITFLENSPGLSNVSFVAAANGDLKPPRR